MGNVDKVKNELFYTKKLIKSLIWKKQTIPFLLLPLQCWFYTFISI